MLSQGDIDALLAARHADPFAALRFAQGASDDVRTFAGSLELPYCGPNSSFEACGWRDSKVPLLVLR